jgi:hypothetical protein
VIPPGEAVFFWPPHWSQMKLKQLVCQVGSAASFRTDLKFGIKINEIGVGRLVRARFGFKCLVVFVNPTVNDLSQEIADAGGDNRESTVRHGSEYPN